MDKTQAYYHLWSQFNLPAYDETSVPDGAKMPYITYQVILDSLEGKVYPTASLWYKTTSWTGIDQKMKEIESTINFISPIKLDEGYMYVTGNTPFAQRMSDEDRSVKRYVLNIGVEFLSN